MLHGHPTRAHMIPTPRFHGIPHSGPFVSYSIAPTLNHAGPAWGHPTTTGEFHAGSALPSVQSDYMGSTLRLQHTGIRETEGERFLMYQHSLI